MGIVAASAHQSGSATSAIRPKAPKVSQKTFRCMQLFYRPARRSVVPISPGCAGSCRSPASWGTRPGVNEGPSISACQRSPGEEKAAARLPGRGLLQGHRFCGCPSIETKGTRFTCPICLIGPSRAEMLQRVQESHQRISLTRPEPPEIIRCIVGFAFMALDGVLKRQ